MIRLANVDCVSFYKVLIFIIFMVVFSPASLSQEPLTESSRLTESGAAYLESLDFTGIQHDLTYFDPNASMPALDTDVLLEPDDDGRTPRLQWSTFRVITLIVASGLVVLILFLLLKYGSKITVSSRSETDNVHSRRNNGRDDTGGQYENIIPLRDVLRLNDRREAIIHLSRYALKTTAKLNNVLLQPSWTGRDALRHLAKDQSYARGLASLVFVSEQVQFGERDISETEFETLRSGIEPLLKQAGG